MRPELEHLRRLERHLLGPAGAVAAGGGPPAGAADAEAQRQAYQVLRQAGRHQLRQELAAIHARLYGPAVGRWAWVARGLRLVFVRARPGRP